MPKIDDFVEMYIDKGKIVLVDATGEKTKRSVYADNEHHNYFIYEDRKYYFAIDMIAEE